MLKSLNNLRSKIVQVLDTPPQITDLKDIILYDRSRAVQASHPNPLNQFGKKCFSQTDEDGITLEILKRMGMLRAAGAYAEFGVEDGTENNSLILAAMKWKGFWVGSDNLKFNVQGKHKRFAYLKEWVTLKNISSIAQQGISAIGVAELDVISLDLDGNDIYFVDELLKSGFRPKLFIVEYNGKFPPPIEFQIAYDDRNIWQGDDYFGAFLSSFLKMFTGYDYRLICCNAHSGANAFFIDARYLSLFPDVPSEIENIYVAPRYHLYNQYGHKKSVRTIERLFEAD